MVSKKEILIINPNSTASMTDGLKPLINHLNFKETSFSYFTAPSGPKSINDETDAAASLTACIPALTPLLPQYDGFLVCCYSWHPMVPWIQDRLGPQQLATGILEASVATALQGVGRDARFGIVSTGKVWEELLAEAVGRMLGVEGGEEEEELAQQAVAVSRRFAGVETTGLNATELHDAPPEVARRKMKEATRRLLAKGKVAAVCLGCAGMSGMNEMVREAAVEELGEELGNKVKIIDGVAAGAAWLEGALRMDF